MFKTAETIFNSTHIFKQLHPWKSKYELASYMCNNIIHTADGVLAINKPFGVGVQSTKTKKKIDVNFVGCEYSLEDVLPLMRQELKSPNLVVAKSAEKFHSGVAIFAENERAINKLQTASRTIKPAGVVNSCYYLVTCHPPYKSYQGETQSEKVAITLDSNPYHNVSQPVIVREYSKNNVNRQDVYIVRVEYEVKHIGRNQTALIELKTNATRMNFLRVYCADMLMPILGDHLYGPRVTTIQGIPIRLNPLHMRPGSNFQQLSPKMRRSLALDEEPDTSLVPLHVHLRSYTLPNFYGRDAHLTISAPFPQHFKWTCNSLNLNLPNPVL